MQGRRLRDLNGGELGFEYEDIRFYTCKPRIYVVGVPYFDHLQLQRYLTEVGLDDYDENQLNGTCGDNLIEAGARDCYLSYGRGRSHGDCIAHLRQMGHGSTFEHSTITIKIAFVSRGLTHELVRHRVGVAYSQVSSRYVAPEKMGFVVPQYLRDDEEAVETFVEACIGALGTYTELYERARAKAKYMGFKDVSTKVARGAAREALPIGLHQVLQMTLNARICRHIIRMRSGPAAEAQIREFAIELARVARRVWPEACGDLELLPNDVLSMEEGI